MAPVRLMAAAGVGDPYRMVSYYNDAVFGRAGDAIAVKDGTVAQITVTSQDPFGGWARPGPIVRAVGRGHEDPDARCGGRA
ncbi:hypothetical protein [Streptomyces sp. NPDC003015]